MQLKIFFLALALFSLQGCLLKKDSPVNSEDNEVNLIKRDDIIVTNNGNDTVVLLHSDGTFKSIIEDSQTDANILYNGLIYDAANKQLLFIYDHLTASFDAIKKVSLFDGTVSTALTNSFVSGVLPGLARLTDGSLLILKQPNIAEKFTAANVRVGAPFTAALTTTVTDVARLANGGFVVCSSATATTARLYTAAGVAGASATSAAPGTSLGLLGSTSCIEDASGNIIVAYTSAIRSYNAALTTVNWTYQDTNNMVSTGKMAIRSNGNILITDKTFNHIVELNSSGGLVQLIGGAVLSGPNNIAVIP